MTSDSKSLAMNDMERGPKGDKTTETSFADSQAGETDKFIQSEEIIASRMEKDGRSTSEFVGLSREELEKYASDPTWIKIRWILFAIFVVGWVAMLVVAIVIVVLEDPCPQSRSLKWFQSGIVYKVDTPVFKDSNADTVGDINGIKEKIDHLTAMGIDTLWLENIMDDTVLSKPNALSGTMEEFASLTKDLKKEGIRVIIDLSKKAEPLTTVASKGGELEARMRGWAESGAEGFVLYFDPAASKEESGELVNRLQGVLDAEFNKRDDRNRLIIVGGLSLGSTTGVQAELLEIECDVSNCNAVEAAVKANVSASGTWKIVQMPPHTANPVLNLIAKLTIPGTVVLYASDERGAYGENEYFRWTDDEDLGFTSNTTFNPGNRFSGDSLMRIQSIGYPDVNTFQLTKELVEARGMYQPLMWGDLSTPVIEGKVMRFERQTTDFADIAVAVSTDDMAEGDGVSIDLTNKLSGEVIYTHGKVLSSVNIAGVEVGDVIPLDKVYFTYQSGVVVEFMQAPLSKE